MENTNKQQQTGKGKAKRVRARRPIAPLVHARVTARRQRIAKAVIAGATSQEIGAAEGVSQRQVRRDAYDPETQDLIAAALSSQNEVLIAGTARAINRMVEGLDAEWKGAPDWRSRGLCARELRELLAMAAGPQTQRVEVKQQGRSIEELLDDYRAFVATVVVEAPDA